MKKTLNCGGKLIDLEIPRVMGILNTTPDSFYAGSRMQDEKALLLRAETMLSEGADMLDVGGYSSRPGAKHVDTETELARVIPAVQALHRAFPEAIVSVDTFRSEVAKQAIEAGAQLVNDISAGLDDPEMLSTVSALGVPYIIMHKQGQPATMQSNPVYASVVLEVFDFLKERIYACQSAGIYDLIIDPGFGFGKTLEHNYTLLRELHSFKILDLPILAGVSRKSMIKSVLKVDSDDALNGTSALHMLCLMQGASLLRVHDVREAVQCICLYERFERVRVQDERIF